MDKFATTTVDERTAIMTETAERRGLSFQIIEKDFWVCWTLKQLFQIPIICDHLIFKGGTSLSKVYKVIARFSEDIDIAVDRKYLGFEDEKDLRKCTARERDEIVSKIDESCRHIVQNEIIGSLHKQFSKIVGEPDDNWSLSIDQNDPFGQTILFEYPKGRNSKSNIIEYIRPIVRIEMGARPENQPAFIHSIRPYVSEEFSDEFEAPEFNLKVLAAERTFWEKATILHDQYHRAKNYKTVDRLSRHYYDFFQLGQSEIANKAINDLKLLENVVVNKMSFFYRAGAKYEKALLGELHLVPSADRLPALKADYEKMQPMFFESPPSIKKILKSLENLENEINDAV